jgi:hypothetical protein
MENEERIDVGTLLANVFMTSNQDNFDENVNRFLDETAEILGDVRGWGDGERLGIECWAGAHFGDQAQAGRAAGDLLCEQYGGGMR